VKFSVPWRVHAAIAESCKTPAEKARAYQRLREFYTGILHWPGPYRSPTAEERAAQSAAIAAQFPWVTEYWVRQPKPAAEDPEEF